MFIVTDLVSLTQSDIKKAFYELNKCFEDLFTQENVSNIPTYATEESDIFQQDLQDSDLGASIQHKRMWSISKRK